MKWTRPSLSFICAASIVLAAAARLRAEPATQPAGGVAVARQPAQQQKLDATRAAFAQFPLIPAMKAAIAWKTGRKDWVHVRPPLVDLTVEQQQTLQASLDQVAFTLPRAGALA